MQCRPHNGVSVSHKRPDNTMPWSSGLLIRYAFKHPSLHDIQLITRNFKIASWSILAPEKICDDIRLHKRARIARSAEAAWSFFKFMNMKIDAPVAGYNMNSENERIMVIRQPSIQSGLSNSSLMRYSEQPWLYLGFLLLECRQKFHLLQKLSTPLLSQRSSIPHEKARIAYVLVSGCSRNDFFSVARVQFIAPVNRELFSLRSTLLEQPMTSIRSGRIWDGRDYSALPENSLTMGL